MESDIRENGKYNLKGLQLYKIRELNGLQYFPKGVALDNKLARLLRIDTKIDSLTKQKI